MRRVDELRRSTGAALCLDCGKCTSTCPLAGLGEFSARLIARESLQGTVPAPSHAAQRCLSCSACEVRCPEGVQVAAFVRGLREMASPEARPPCPHGGVFEAVARSMAGAATTRRELDWLGPDLRVAETGEVALFVGCLPFFDRYFGEELDLRVLDVARAAIRILNHVGIEPVLVAEERCCGHDLLWGGDREAFTALATANAEAFAARGVKHIVTACAECCRTWRLDYPEAAPGYRPRVEHVSEFLADRIERGELHLEGDGASTLTFQDPCRLGRHLGVVEAPRKALAALPGIELVEMARSGVDAECCGTCGFLHCDADSRALQVSRLTAAAATGAERLVTACPKCLIHFTCARAEDQRAGRPAPTIEIEDLSVLAAAHLAGTAVANRAVPATLGCTNGETT